MPCMVPTFWCKHSMQKSGDNTQHRAACKLTQSAVRDFRPYAPPVDLRLHASESAGNRIMRVLPWKICCHHPPELHPPVPVAAGLLVAVHVLVVVLQHVAGHRLQAP